MTTDFGALARNLLNNFITVRVPRTEGVWAFRDRGLPSATYARCLENAMRCERLVAGSHRNTLRLGLYEHGQDCFLDRLEGALGGNRRIHLFLADEAAVQLVPSLTALVVGPGDPIYFDPVAFVERRLRQIDQLYQRTGRYEWLLDDEP